MILTSLWKYACGILEGVTKSLLFSALQMQSTTDFTIKLRGVPYNVTEVS